MTEWTIEYQGSAPLDEGRREALCTLGNGIFATRGASPESRADGIHYPGTYCSGVFNRLVSQVGGRTGEHESMVNLPNWLSLSLRAEGGDWLDLSGMEVAGFTQELDLYRGMLTRRFRVTDAEGRQTSVAERRFVSMSSPHLAALEWTVEPENWSGALEIRTGIDGEIENRNVAAERDLSGRHVRTLGTGEDGDAVWLEAETVQSHVRVVEACRTRVERAGQRTAPKHTCKRRADGIDQHLVLDGEIGVALRVEKIAALFTSRDRAISEPRLAALDEVRQAGSFEELLSAHVLEWKHLWRRFRLELEDGDVEVARTLNLHIFHVLQTLSRHVVDHDVGVPARGLHGEGYRGHIFWDELFVFPFLNLRLPELTRELLLYRYRRLPAARRMAREMGLDAGARYPWQSGSDGREETPTEFFNPRSGRWMSDNSWLQHHVSLAVAYNVWHYYEVTGDRRFLGEYGGEMLFEIARFWVELAVHDSVTERYDIRGVMGPDEFHDGYPDRPGQGIDNNAYTNVMVSWLLCRAVDVHSIIAGHQGSDLWDRLGLTTAELQHWDEVSRKLTVPFRPDGIISQFEGYEELEEFDWVTYRERYGDIHRLDLLLESEGDTTNRYKLSKQADVLMLLYLFSAEELVDLMAHLGYDFDPAVIPDIVDYYVARMSHGSTLCRVVVAWVLSRVDRPRSWRVFREALASDVGDIQGGTTREGVHLGAMAGTIDLVQRCYLGVEARDDVLWFNPRLPAHLNSIGCSLRYRGQWLDVEATEEVLRVGAQAGDAGPVQIGFREMPVGLEPGRRVEWQLLGDRDRDDGLPVPVGAPLG